jgi:hypothetical protein
MAPTEEEARLGFEAQTLTYPEGQYELSGLEAPEKAGLDRTVAVTLDGASRIRRRHGGTGYVREMFNSHVWTVSEVFECLRDVAESDAYRDYRQREEAEAGVGSEAEAREAE